MENQKDNMTPEQQPYQPRSAWQVWAARIGLVLFILLVIVQYLHIARGGL